MKSLKILHTADLHLDSPFEGLPAGKAAVRRGEQRELLTRLCELAAAEEVDLVLLAGDLLDSASSYAETGQELMRALRALSVPVFLAPGNHDFYGPRSPYARLRLPENVHLFTRNSLEVFELPALGAAVYGAAFTGPESAGLLTGFHAPRREGIYNLLCLHGEVCAGESRYDPITEAELAASGMDYVALGHVHKASGLLKAGESWYSWPGCPEGRGFDECGDKFVNIITLEGDRCQLQTRSIASRRYQILRLDVSETEPLLAVHNALPDDTVRDIYRIVFTGFCPEAPDLRRLQANLTELFFQLQLRDETKIRRSVWDCAGEDSLRGIFLRKLREQYEASADEESRSRIEQAARWGLAALDGMEEVVSHENQ